MRLNSIHAASHAYGKMLWPASSSPSTLYEYCHSISPYDKQASPGHLGLLYLKRKSTFTLCLPSTISLIPFASKFLRQLFVSWCPFLPTFSFSSNSPSSSFVRGRSPNSSKVALVKVADDSILFTPVFKFYLSPCLNCQASESFCTTHFVCLTHRDTLLRHLCSF